MNSRLQVSQTTAAAATAEAAAAATAAAAAATVGAVVSKDEVETRSQTCMTRCTGCRTGHLGCGYFCTTLLARVSLPTSSIALHHDRNTRAGGGALLLRCVCQDPKRVQPHTVRSTVQGRPPTVVPSRACLAVLRADPSGGRPDRPERFHMPTTLALVDLEEKPKVPTDGRRRGSVVNLALSYAG